jgi:hypothetical protein
LAAFFDLRLLLRAFFMIAPIKLSVDSLREHNNGAGLPMLTRNMYQFVTLVSDDFCAHD